MAQFAGQISSDIEYALAVADVDALAKSAVIANAMTKLPESLRGLKIEVTGDNWLGGDQIIPDFTASIAVTERDDQRNIVATAIATARGGWQHRAVAGSKEGAFVLTGTGEFQKIEHVNRLYLGDNPSTSILRAQIFGQKPTPHWVAMNKAIGFLNGAGVRAANDCGPYFAIVGWFAIVKNGEITPLNMIYSEPFLNKPKEEVVAFLVDCLNHGLVDEDDRFVLTDMSGAPLFTKASGWIASPTSHAHKLVLGALMLASEEEGFLDTSLVDKAKDIGSVEKMDTLRHDLSLVV